MLFIIFIFKLFLVSLSYKNHSQKFVGSLSFGYPYESFLPGWVTFSNAKIHKNYVRLTSDISDITGAIWSHNPVLLENWRVEIEFRIGSGMEYIRGGKGLAFWVTDVPHGNGILYGNVSNFNGMGIVLESMDELNFDLPSSVYFIYNDGKSRVTLMEKSDPHILGKCTYPFRSYTEGMSIILKVSYFYKELTVSLMKSFDDEEKNCFTINNVELGRGKYFGVTAESGFMSDEHVIYRFETYNLSPEISVQPDIVNQKKYPSGTYFVKENDNDLYLDYSNFNEESDSNSNYNNMDDILDSVEEEEMKIRKRRMSHYSEEELRKEIDRGSHLHEFLDQADYFLDKDFLNSLKLDSQKIDFTKSESDKIESLIKMQQYLINLTVRLTTLIEHSATKDELQAIHALLISSNIDVAKNYEEKLKHIQNKLNNNLDFIENKFQESKDHTNFHLDNQKTILRDLKKSTTFGWGWFAMLLLIGIQIMVHIALYLWKSLKKEKMKKMW